MHMHVRVCMYVHENAQLCTCGYISTYNNNNLLNGRNRVKKLQRRRTINTDHWENAKSRHMHNRHYHNNIDNNHPHFNEQTTPLPAASEITKATTIQINKLK